MIRISFWGDVKIDDVSELTIDNSVRTILESCEANVINFEAPIKGTDLSQRKSGPSIFQDPNVPKWLMNNKFNVISLANNHIMDFGIDGLRETLKCFHNTILVGAGTWEEAYQLKIFEIHQKKIGFLSATHCEFGTLTDQYDTNNIWGAAWICHPSFPAIIQSSKRQVDFLVVLSHAGVENIDVPLPEWRDVYRSIIDFGADVIIGTHPHVPQGWETHSGKTIFYSLGNFCFQKRSRNPGKFWNESLGIILNIDCDCNYSYNVVNAKYNNSKIHLSNEPEIKLHITEIQKLLLDKDLYISRVNETVELLFKSYQNLFGSSGYPYITFSIPFLKTILKFFLKRNKYSPTHILNNLRCESHRWAIIRAIKNKHNLM